MLPAWGFSAMTVPSLTALEWMTELELTSYTEAKPAAGARKESVPVPWATTSPRRGMGFLLDGEAQPVEIASEVAVISSRMIAVVGFMGRSSREGTRGAAHRR